MKVSGGIFKLNHILFTKSHLRNKNKCNVDVIYGAFSPVHALGLVAMKW